MNIRRKRIFFISFAVFISLFLSVCIGEILIRTLNIPGIDKNTYYAVDPLLGYGYIPNAKLYYLSDRGDAVLRDFNSLGYLDREHKKAREKDIYRIGFFGDSFTEARQVPLENTFFGIIERELKDYNVECMAFGREDGGTLVAYMDNARRTPYFDLDAVIYVFCENDPGDNIKEIKEKTSPYFPFGVLAKSGYEIDYSRRDEFIRFSQTFAYKVRKYISNHLLLSRVIKNRLSLFINYGLRVRLDEEERKMATRVQEGNIPDQNDLPSTWPDHFREYAEDLASAIILKWRAELRDESRGFAVFYVPRETEMEKETGAQDSWKPWLEDFCARENIAFIDPTEDLVRLQRSGKESFYDHFTPHGHRAFAGAFIKWFKEKSEN